MTRLIGENVKIASLLFVLCTCLGVERIESFQVLGVISKIGKRQATVKDSPQQEQEQEVALVQRDLLEKLDDAFSYEGRVDSRVRLESYRSGYVSVMGAANMGKSTLVNALVGEPLCIATPRPQTTRHVILGILSTDNCQVCLLDTPGVMAQPAYKLQEGMMQAVRGALKDADVLLVVTDVFSTPIPNDLFFTKVQQTDKPTIVVINKIDLLDKVNATATKTVSIEQAVATWRQLLPQAVAILPACASRGYNDTGVQALRKLLTASSSSNDDQLQAALRALGRPILGMFATGTYKHQQPLLPLGPPLYDPDLYTDRSERFLASEIIREALLETLSKELPYCCQVQVTSFKEQQPARTMILIHADIFVERDSQKIIVIGKQGDKIKQLGILARLKLQEFFQTKINLQLLVKVDKDWRNKDDKLKLYGYSVSSNSNSNNNK